MRILTTGVLAIGLAFSVLGQDLAPVERAAKDGVLLVGNGGEPRGLDPQQVTGVLESNIARALFEGLCLEHPSKDGVALPGAAERWEANRDWTVWTFHLRRDGAWSDGTPVTAKDFLFSYQRILTPEFGAGYAEMLYVIEGAEAYHKGTSTRFEEVGVKALDEFTLQVALRRPTPFLPEIAKHYTWFPVPRHIVMKWNDGRIQSPDPTWTRPGNLVGNGPFRLKSWQPEEEVLMAELPAIPIYWYTVNYLVDDRVAGWSPLLLGGHPYKFLFLQPSSP